MNTHTIATKYHRRYTNSSAISASGTWNVPIPAPDVERHRYFNQLEVVNLSSSTIDVKLNLSSDFTYRLPANSARTLSFTDDNIKYDSISVTDLTGAEIGADTIEIVVSKKKLQPVGIDEAER